MERGLPPSPPRLAPIRISRRRPYLGDMADTNTGRRGARGRGTKSPPAFRVEVIVRHGAPAPFGWRVFRRGEKRPIEQSVSGYSTEADAWSAGGSAVIRLEVVAPV
jgi:hypothetical protein